MYIPDTKSHQQAVFIDRHKKLRNVQIQVFLTLEFQYQSFKT